MKIKEEIIKIIRVVFIGVVFFTLTGQGCPLPQEPELAIELVDIEFPYGKEFDKPVLVRIFIQNIGNQVYEGQFGINQTTQFGEHKEKRLFTEESVTIRPQGPLKILYTSFHLIEPGIYSNRIEIIPSYGDVILKNNIDEKDFPINWLELVDLHLQSSSYCEPESVELQWCLLGIENNGNTLFSVNREEEMLYATITAPKESISETIPIVLDGTIYPRTTWWIEEYVPTFQMKEGSFVFELDPLDQREESNEENNQLELDFSFP